MLTVKNYFEFSGSKEHLEKLIPEWKMLNIKNEDMIKDISHHYNDNGNLNLYIEHEFDLSYEVYVRHFASLAKGNNVNFCCVIYDSNELSGIFSVAVYKSIYDEPKYFGFTTSTKNNIKSQNNGYTYTSSEICFESFKDVLLFIAKEQYGVEQFDIHIDNTFNSEKVEVKTCQELDSGMFLIQLSNGAELIVDNRNFHSISLTLSLDEAIDTIKNKFEYPWRLPSIQELGWMAEHIFKKGKGNFDKTPYWSNEFKGSDGGYTYVFGGGVEPEPRTAKCNVRLVLEVDEKVKPNLEANLKIKKSHEIKKAKNILKTDEIMKNENKSFVIEKNSKGQKLEVAEHDFPNKMNWDDAMKSCEKLGDGWRLPSRNELKQMYIQLHQKDLGNFKKDSYISSTLTSSDNACFYYFGDDGYSGSNYKYFDEWVRAVRDFKKPNLVN
jgi:hypothetical protein